MSIEAFASSLQIFATGCGYCNGSQLLHHSRLIRKLKCLFYVLKLVDGSDISYGAAIASIPADLKQYDHLLHMFKNSDGSIAVLDRFTTKEEQSTLTPEDIYAHEKEIILAELSDELLQKCIDAASKWTADTIAHGGCMIDCKITGIDPAIESVTTKEYRSHNPHTQGYSLFRMDWPSIYATVGLMYTKNDFTFGRQEQAHLHGN